MVTFDPFPVSLSDVEEFNENPVKLPRGGQVVSERLFDDDARLICQTRGTQPFDNRRKQSGIVQIPLSTFNRFEKNVTRHAGAPPR